MLPQNIILAAVTLTATFTDMKWGKVYNWLTFPAAALGVALSFFFAPPDPWQSLLGLAGALVMYGILRKVGRMGAGDVKLMAAVGALKGLPFVVFASIYIIVIAGVASIVILAWERRLIPALRWVAATMASLLVPNMEPLPFDGGKTEMPFAPAIFLGVLWCLYLEATFGPFSFQ
jgi:prepilin peptidase CpaA